MTTDRRVLVHPDKASLAGAVAARFITKIIDILDEFDEAHVVLSGGSVNTALMAAIRNSPAQVNVDWQRINFWWGDERFVAKDSPDRNELQAREALLDHIPVDEGKVPPFASS